MDSRVKSPLSSLENLADRPTIKGSLFVFHTYPPESNILYPTFSMASFYYSRHYQRVLTAE